MKKNSCTGQSMLIVSQQFAGISEYEISGPQSSLSEGDIPVPASLRSERHKAGNGAEQKSSSNLKEFSEHEISVCRTDRSERFKSVPKNDRLKNTCRQLNPAISLFHVFFISAFILLSVVSGCNCNKVTPTPGIIETEYSVSGRVMLVPAELAGIPSPSVDAEITLLIDMKGSGSFMQAEKFVASLDENGFFEAGTGTIKVMPDGSGQARARDLDAILMAEKDGYITAYRRFALRAEQKARLDISLFEYHVLERDYRTALPDDSLSITGLPERVKEVKTRLFNPYIEPHGATSGFSDPSGESLSFGVVAAVKLLDASGEAYTECPVPVHMRMELADWKRPAVIAPGRGPEPGSAISREDILRPDSSFEPDDEYSASPVLVPLYAFNETRKEWRFEATGRLESLGGAPLTYSDLKEFPENLSGKRIFVRADITHFSRWAYAWPEKSGCLEGVLLEEIDGDMTIASGITVFGGRFGVSSGGYALTDHEGRFCIDAHADSISGNEITLYAATEDGRTVIGNINVENPGEEDRTCRDADCTDAGEFLLRRSGQSPEVCTISVQALLPDMIPVHGSYLPLSAEGAVLRASVLYDFPDDRAVLCSGMEDGSCMSSVIDEDGFGTISVPGSEDMVRLEALLVHQNDDGSEDGAGEGDLNKVVFRGHTFVLPDCLEDAAHPSEAETVVLPLGLYRAGTGDVNVFPESDTDDAEASLMIHWEAYSPYQGHGDGEEFSENLRAVRVMIISGEDDRLLWDVIANENFDSAEEPGMESPLELRNYGSSDPGIIQRRAPHIEAIMDPSINPDARVVVYVSGERNGAIRTGKGGEYIHTGMPSSSRSTLSADRSEAVADGEDAILLSAHVMDHQGNPLPGIFVEFSGSGEGHLFSSEEGETDEEGIFETFISSTKAGEKTVTAILDDGMASLNQNILFVAGDPDEEESGIETEGSPAVADGVESIEIIITVRDSYENPVQGMEVNLFSTEDMDIMEPAGGFTDENGKIRATIKSTLPGERTVSANIGDFFTLNSQIIFTGAGAYEIERISGDAQVAVVMTQATEDFIVKISDEHGNPVAGYTVNFSIEEAPAGASGHSLSVTNPSTDAGGIASSNITPGNRSGIYRIAARAPGLIGSPVIFNITARAADADSILVSGIPSPIPAGNPAAVNLEILDAHGNRQPAYTGTVGFTSTDLSADLPPDYHFTAVDGGFLNLDGLLTFISPGIHSVTVTDLNNPEITGVQAGIVVEEAPDEPGVASPQTTTITSSLSSIVADGVSTATITVRTRDEDGNYLGAGGDIVEIESSAGTLDAVTDYGNGIYRAVLTSSTSIETALITGTLNGEPISSQAMVNFTVGPSSSTTSTITAYPGSIPADGISTSSITVQVKDVSGNNRNIGGDTVVLSTNRGSIGTVTDNGDGTYTSLLTSSSSSGTALVTGTLNGDLISSQALVNFTDGDDPPLVCTPNETRCTGNVREECNAEGTGWTVIASCTHCCIDGDCVDYICTPDERWCDGNTVIECDGGCAQTVIMNCAGAAPCCIDGECADYTCNPDERWCDGNILMECDGGCIGAVVKNCSGAAPYCSESVEDCVQCLENEHCFAGRICESGNCVSDGSASPAASSITASPDSIPADGNSTSTLTVQVKNAARENIQVGGDTVELFSTCGELSQVTDNNDGTYSAILTSSTTSGIVYITAKLNGDLMTEDAQVSFNPLAANKLSFIQQPQEVFSGAIMEPKLKVAVQDVNGNLVGDADHSIILSLESNPGGGSLFGNLTVDASFGIAVFDDIFINETGTGYTIRAEADNLTYTVSEPFNVISAPASHVTTTISAASQDSPVYADGADFYTITVQTRDLAGNLIESGGDNVELHTTLGTLSAVTDHNDGTYTALLHSEQAGTGTVTGKLNGINILSQASVEFALKPASPLTTTISVNQDIMVGDGVSTVKISVLARDADNEILDRGNDTVTLDSNLGSIGQITDHNNGLYTAWLTSPVNTGTALISGTINGEIIQDTASVIIFDGIIRVKSGVQPGGDGLSWPGAFNDLQDALLFAETAGIEIWVAAGTYKPTDGTDRTISFEMVEGVGMYGGFAGNEQSRDQRNFEENVTILSGDIGNPGDNSDNSRHVITGAKNTVIDGFTITGGNADGDWPHSRGGGLFSRHGDEEIKVSNCIFRDNRAQLSGAGIYGFDLNLIIKDSVFEDNYSKGQGAGINLFYADAQIENTVFKNNHTLIYGGGIFSENSDVIINNSHFIDNMAERGGGIFNGRDSILSVSGTRFISNRALAGGGIINRRDSSSVIVNSIFSDNISHYGAGISNYEHASSEIINSVISRNNAGVYGGGIRNFGNLEIINTIIWGNLAETGKSIHEDNTSSITVENSIIEDGNFPGSLDEDPLFIDAESHNYRVSPDSPAVDAGTDLPFEPGGSAAELGITEDLDNNPRIVGSAVDIGPFEHQLPDEFIIEPAIQSIASGFSVMLTATITYNDGSSIDISSGASWVSDDPGTAVMNDSVVTGINPGNAQITASYKGLEAEMELIVTDATLSGISVSPSPANIPLGSKLQFQATGSFSDGTAQDISSIVNWSVTDENLAEINDGMVLGLGVGQTFVIAELNSIDAETELNITNAELSKLSLLPLFGSIRVSELRQYQLIAYYSDGSYFDVSESADTIWETGPPLMEGDPVIELHSPSIFEGMSEGFALVYAIYGGLTAEAVTHVQGGVLEELQISSPQSEVPAGLSIQLNATGIYSNNNLLDHSDVVTWHNGNENVASISDDGMLEAVATGSTVIYASLDGTDSNSITIEVIDPVPVEVIISPAAVNIFSGDTVLFSAAQLYSDGTITDCGDQVFWSSGDELTAYISNDPGNRGEATGNNPGVTTITAICHDNDIEGTASIEVEEVLESIEINPPDAVITSGMVISFTATGHYTGGEERDITNLVDWSSSDITVADIDNQGNASGIGLGDTTVTASLDGISFEVQLHVFDGIWKVDAAASGEETGLSWDSAFKDLQDALSAAQNAGHEIWVAAGTYKPTDGTERSYSFNLVEGVELYGGFEGVEQTRDERNHEVNETILSGDIGVQGVVADNSYHVVRGADNTVLDGFIISFGNASGSASHEKLGGGMLLNGVSMEIRNCIFRENRADYLGGGIYAINSVVVLENSEFLLNEANEGGGIFFDTGEIFISDVLFDENEAQSGGAVYIEENVTAEIDSSVFSNNTAHQNGGGGLYSFRSFVQIYNTHFTGNKSEGGSILSRGGGIFCGETEILIRNCHFTGNESDRHGAGMWNDSSDLTIEDSQFTGNTTYTSGGGIYNWNTDAVISTSVFSNNAAYQYGGGIYSNNSTISLFRNIIENNYASWDGGGIYNAGNGMAIIISSLLVGNTASYYGGAIFNDNKNLQVINCTISDNESLMGGGPGIYLKNTDAGVMNTILWGNPTDHGEQVFADDDSNLSIAFSCIEGNAYQGNSNIHSDPLFEDPASGNYRLQPSSPAVDAGVNSPYEPGGAAHGENTDLEGNPRIAGDSVDMGAYERQ